MIEIIPTHHKVTNKWSVRPPKLSWAAVCLNIEIRAWISYYVLIIGWDVIIMSEIRSWMSNYALNNTIVIIT